MEEFFENSSQDERRAQPRFLADSVATLLLVSQGSGIPCRILALSLGGCRLSVALGFRVGNETPVEVSFRVNGLAFRLGGVVQWTDGKQTAGIRFSAMSSRRRDELAEVIAELEAEQLARNAKEAAEKAAEKTAEEAAEVAGEATSQSGKASPEPVAVTSAVPRPAVAALIGKPELPAAKEHRPPPTKGSNVVVYAPSMITAPATLARTDSSAAAPALLSKSATSDKPWAIDTPSLRTAPAPRTPPRERRQQARHSVDTQAALFFIAVAARVLGRILDVSMTGCRIRTDERFPSGIYRRVETEFKIDGLPFRLGGVVQSIHDRHAVGIRFLNVSDRKREHLQELMDEIEEMRQSGRLLKPESPSARP